MRRDASAKTPAVRILRARARCTALPPALSVHHQRSTSKLFLVRLSDVRNQALGPRSRRRKRTLISRTMTCWKDSNSDLFLMSGEQQAKKLLTYEISQGLGARVSGARWPSRPAGRPA
mmetsp:Transcript_152938/g.490643  ORF Transcript_152938/g.490643 Transcript_152938/m.490643 type:complete len:118 (+) Transcript_152938:140-493(+)